ncbi:hypothetical protein STRTUCAR8_02331, partial [Streptomyces turgidiscabies Car8]
MRAGGGFSRVPRAPEKQGLRPMLFGPRGP